MLQQNAVPPATLDLLKKSTKSKKDFWDIAALLKQYSLDEILNLFKIKFSQVDNGFIIHSLTDFEIADMELDPDSYINITWDEIKLQITNEVRNYTRGFL